MQQYWGKIIGIAFAIVMGVRFWDVILGLLIGHIFDEICRHKLAWLANQREHHVLFLTTTFEVTGHLAKSKGRVTEKDIQMASIFMDRMNLHGESRIAAQNAFRIGKADNYPLRKKIRQFRRSCFGHSDLIKMFMEIQIQAAFADGSLHPNERDVLHVIVEELGISHSQFDQFLRILQGSERFSDCYEKQQDFNGGWKQAQCGSTLENFCNVLGVKPSDDAMTIKRAYRKLMGEYHPDKLVAKGLSPEMIEVAKRKAQEIQKAYKLIKEHKGFK